MRRLVMVVVVVMSLVFMVSMVSMVFFYVHCSVSSTMMSIMMESIMNTMNAAVVPPNMTPIMTSMMVVVSAIMLSSMVSCLLMYTLMTSVLCFCQGRKDNEQDKQGHQSMWLEGDCLSRTGFCDKRVEYLSATVVVGGSQKLANGNLWTRVGKKHKGYLPTIETSGVKLAAKYELEAKSLFLISMLF